MIDSEYGNGFAMITLMVPNYDAENLGDIMLRAKEGAVLSKEKQNVALNAEYVQKYEAGSKVVLTDNVTTSSTTLGNGTSEPVVPGDTNDDSTVDLIDLSNVIDWFGFNNSEADWENMYTYYDFNNNDEIDICDISYIARQIG